MDKSNKHLAQQIAKAANDFEYQITGHTPKSVTVVLSDSTLVITLHGSLSPAEQTLAQSPEGAAQVQEFHRQLFANASESLRKEIKRITGVDVREAAAEVEPATGTVVKVFTTGTVVQVFLLGGSLPVDSWTGTVPNDRQKTKESIHDGYVEDGLPKPDGQSVSSPRLWPDHDPLGN